MYAIANLLDTVITLYIWCLLIYVIMSWLISFGLINTGHRLVYLVMDVLFRITEPALRPIRNLVPTLGNIDISPIILVLVLVFIRNLVLVDLVGMR